MNTLKSSMYRLVKNKEHLIHIIAPIIAVVVFGLYFLVTSYSGLTKVYLYMEIIGILMPAMISIVITKQYENEKKAGGFYNILTYPHSRIIGHFSNMMILLLWGFLATFISIMGMYILMSVTAMTDLSIQWFFISVLTIYLASIGWYFISYVICFSFGSGISLGCGVIGSIIAALMRVGLPLGDRIWQYLPSSYATRIIMSKIKLLAPESVVEEEYIRYTVKSGMPMVIILSILAALVFVIWSRLWQGNKEAE